MALLKTAAILTRLSELVHDGLGDVRPIDAARFTGGLHDGLSGDHLSLRGSQIQKPCEISIEEQRHPQRLVITGSVQIHQLSIQIRVVRTLTFEARVNDATRRAYRALAAEDASALTQALEWPGNLVLTSDGTATDLKGIVYQRSLSPVVGVEGASMRIDTTHQFTGTAISRPATA